MTTEVQPKRTRKPKARNYAVILGALDENARMLLRDPNVFGIGERISDLLEELHRSLSGKSEDGSDE